MPLKVVKNAYRAPNTNAFVERFIQSISTECLDRFVIFGELNVRLGMGNSFRGALCSLARTHGSWGRSSCRRRVVELLVEQVVFDYERGGVAIGFRETGITTLAAELAERKEMAA